MKRWKATSSDAGVRLVSFIKEKLASAYSLRKIKRAIENNFCTVNHLIERFASFKLSAGDIIEFDDSEMVESKAGGLFKIERERILFEDEALIAYDKPSGLASDESGLATFFKGFFLVHRLDKETSGIILFAKKEGAAELLKELFKKREVEKTYLALCDGVFKKSSGYLESYIGKISKEGTLPIFGAVKRENGRKAKTEWEVVKQGKSAALVRCRPITGRTHQIRVHMKQMGHPIVGDFRYARKFHSTLFVKRCLLHAETIQFHHPLSGTLIKLHAPLAQDFKKAKELLIK